MRANHLPESRPDESKGRLIYVVGPSGAGKDSLIDYARAHIDRARTNINRARAHMREENIVFAQRTITRPQNAGGETHHAVSQSRFDAMLAEGAFAMHWQANGFCYGIGREIHDWLAAGRTVVISGSRAHLPAARAAFPQMEVVQVSARPEQLRARLIERGRETDEQLTARLARGAIHALPEGTADLQIANDGSLEHAGDRLLEFLLRR